MNQTEMDLLGSTTWAWPDTSARANSCIRAAVRKIGCENKARALFSRPILRKIKRENKARALFSHFILRKIGRENRARTLFSHPILHKIGRENRARTAHLIFAKQFGFLAYDHIALAYRCHAYAACGGKAHRNMIKKLQRILAKFKRSFAMYGCWTRYGRGYGLLLEASPLLQACQALQEQINESFYVTEWRTLHSSNSMLDW